MLRQFATLFKAQRLKELLYTDLTWFGTYPLGSTILKANILQAKRPGHDLVFLLGYG